jgi:FkbM family methyltransferase
MYNFQKTTQFFFRLIPVGWKYFLPVMVKIFPSLRQYKAKLANGQTIYLDLSQSMCHTLFYRGGSPHNQGIEKLMKLILKNGSSLVDVGANLGQYVKVGYQLVGEGGKVNAFEPLPSVMKLLKLNAFMNDFQTSESNGYKRHFGTSNGASVEIHECAVSDQDGFVSFYTYPSGDESSLTPNDDAVEIKVPMLTLDTVLNDLTSCDLIKIDVEGFELEVLKGGVELLKKHQPVIIFEFLVAFNENRNFTTQTYKDILEPLGYTLYWCNHSDDGKLIRKEPQSSDIVAIPPKWSHVV